jgi:hypothetical protein
MKVLASRGRDVGSKNKDKTSEDVDLARVNSGRKATVEVDKARVRYYQIGATEEVLAREKGREGREEKEEGSSELHSSHGGLTRRLIREGRLFS